MLKNLVVTVIVWIFVAGCIKDRSESVCQYDECALKAPASEITAVQKYLSDNNITATQHCSGLFYTIQSPGTGSTPGICSYIGVRYRGRLTDGTVFDEQTNPFFFQLSELITAWKNGLMKIKQGGSMRLFVPPTLGYGNQDQRDNNGNVVIPANSILIFDIELAQVQ